MITQVIWADVNNRELDTVYARTGDEEIREIQFIICRNDPPEKVEVPADVSGQFRMIKSSGNFVVRDMAKTVQENGTVIFKVAISDQMVNVQGTGYYDIRLSGGGYLYTASGKFIVDSAVISSGVLEDVSEVNGIVFPDDFLTVEDHVAIIDDDTISTDSTWSSNKINEEIESHAGGDVSKTVSGNPITFTDGANAPLVKCVTQITGYQQGSGTPSPDNIRPIVAYTDGKIEVSDGDGNTTTHTTTYPYAIYRGSEDVVNGEVTSEWRKVVFDGTEQWTLTSYNIFSLAISDIKNPETAADRRTGIISSCFPVSSGTAIWDSMDDKSMLKNDGKIFIRNTDCATVSDFQAFIVGAELAYELATPTTETITPTNLPIKSLSGYNHIESTTGDMEVEYITERFQPLIDSIKQL